MARVGGEERIAGFGLQTPDTDARFLLTSITKALTALQLFVLEEQGAIDLAAPIRELIPELGSAQAAVTPRHVLTHTAGIAPRANVVEGPASSLDANDYLQIAMQARLVSAPGDRFAYSSPGYWVLAELISRAGGIPYSRHLQRAVAEPLRLRSLRYEPAARLPRRYVRPRTPRDIARAEQVRQVAYPAGGAVSNVRDLLRLGLALVEPAPAGLLSEPALRAMATPAASGRVRSARVVWGVGWELGGPGTRRSSRTLFHSGASGTALWVDFDAGLVVSLLTADWRLDRRALGRVVDGIYRLSSSVQYSP